MQVLGDRTHSGRQHGIYTLTPHGTGDHPLCDINAPDDSLWRAPECIWHLGSFETSHHITNHFVYSEQPPPVIARTNSHDYHRVTDFHVPFAEWPSLVTEFDKCENPTAPSNAALRPPTPQNALATLVESLQPPKESEWNTSSLSPVSPINPKGGPTTEKKRNKNRLAAAKCREKAKRGLDQLKQRETDLLRENKMLNVQACLLREEVLQLKAEILRHNMCDNHYINQYIQRTAKQAAFIRPEAKIHDTHNCVDL